MESWVRLVVDERRFPTDGYGMPSKASDRNCGADPPKNEAGRIGTSCPKEMSSRLVSAGNGSSIAANSFNKES